MLEIIAAGARHANHRRGRDWTAALRDGDLPLPAQVLAGQAAFAGHDIRRRALGHHLATVDPGSRPHVDDVIGAQDRFLVVLHHQHRVPEVAQALETLEEAGVVPLVQAYGGFIKNV
jgi:hypothetical protein